MNFDDQAHRMREQFLLDTFLLIGASVIAMPTLFVDSKTRICFFSIQAGLYILIIASLIRLALASYFSSAYLFAISANQIANSDGKREELSRRENRFKRWRNVHPIWFLVSLVAVCLIAILKIVAVYFGA